MNAVLSNPKHPEYGQFTVPLPIPHNQYDGIMEALNAMDMGDPLARDCQMDEILCEYPILKRLEGKPVNIDELDYLAKRLDSFCYAQEGAQFQGAAVSYPFDKARLVVREMADSLALDLVDKGLVTNQLVLTVGYDIENLAPTRGGAAYAGETTTDRYGRKIPKHAVGTENFSYTSSANDLLETITALYDRIVDKALLVRRLSISANRLLHEEKVPKQDEVEQLDLFTDYAAKEKQKAENAAEHARERKIQETILGIKKKFGKNAILKGLNLEDGATARERNQTIGGHQA